MSFQLQHNSKHSSGIPSATPCRSQRHFPAIPRAFGCFTPPSHPWVNPVNVKINKCIYYCLSEGAVATVSHTTLLLPRLCWTWLITYCLYLLSLALHLSALKDIQSPYKPSKILQTPTKSCKIVIKTHNFHQNRHLPWTSLHFLVATGFYFIVIICIHFQWFSMIFIDLSFQIIKNPSKSLQILQNLCEII